jgi:hypothetical protein
MSLLKEKPDNITPREWMDLKKEQHHMDWQRKSATFLLWAYGTLLVFTIIIIFLVGWKVGGFELPQPLLTGIAGATIGEVGGLALLVYGFFFKKK